MSSTSDSLLFFGRLHPLLVHLPIGLIVLLAFLELLALLPGCKRLNAGAGVILAFAVPVSCLSVACGYVLSLSGGYDAKLLQWHQYAGFATLAVYLTAVVLYVMNRKTAYRLAIFASFLVLAIASHFGGSLTHGSDYLGRYAPRPIQALLGYRPSAEPASVVEAPAPQGSPEAAFATAILPMLRDNCVSCHGPEKAKGGLRVDSFEALLKGGKHGPAVAQGKSAESELIRRLRLPLEDEDHMPPEGKPQPSEKHLAILEWWINAGADRDKTVAELKPPANIAGLLSARAETPATASTEPAKTEAPARAREEILPIAAKITEDMRIPITPLSETDPWLQVNASVLGAKFADAELEQIAQLGANVKWLDLGGTKVTDAGLAKLAAMPNLVRLHLERTGITDDGLAQIVPLVNLEYLNLYGTQVSDAGLEKLRALPNLKQLYLWQTQVKPEAAKAFADSRVDKLQIQRWKEEIEQLEAKLRNMRMLVDVGTLAIAETSAKSNTPVNTVCPISGKPVDASKTSVYEGVVVAFCCGDCKAKFDKDPASFRDKLQLPATAQAKPVNTKCPISGKDVDPQFTVPDGGRLVGFCCKDCKAKFEKDPAAFRDKVQVAAAAASETSQVKPVNAKCPVSGKDVNPEVTFLHEGKLIAFCCNDCKASFQKDPKAYAGKLTQP